MLPRKLTHLERIDFICFCAFSVFRLILCRFSVRWLYKGFSARRRWFLGRYVTGGWPAHTRLAVLRSQPTRNRKNVVPESFRLTVAKENWAHPVCLTAAWRDHDTVNQVDRCVWCSCCMSGCVCPEFLQHCLLMSAHIDSDICHYFA